MEAQEDSLLRLSLFTAAADSSESTTLLVVTLLEYKPKHTQPLKFESINAEDLITTAHS
jgi:hypothetical protein